MSAPAIAVVVPSWNTCELLRECLLGLREVADVELEVCVVDNASADGSAEMVAREFPEVRLIGNERNLGFAAACNQGIAATGADRVLLLNADARVDAGCPARLGEFLEAHAEHAAVAPRLVNPDGSTQPSCMAFPNLWTPLFFGTPLERWWPRSPELRRYFQREFDHESERDVDQPAAACLLLRRAALERVGALDERLFLFFNDVDLCLRLREEGWRIRFLPGARALHHRGRSTAQYADFVPEWHRNRLVYYRKHFGWLSGVWVKACVVTAWADFALSQLVRRLAGRPAEPVHPLTRSLGAFLRL